MVGRIGPPPRDRAPEPGRRPGRPADRPGRRPRHRPGPGAWCSTTWTPQGDQAALQRLALWAQRLYSPDRRGRRARRPGHRRHRLRASVRRRGEDADRHPRTAGQGRPVTARSPSPTAGAAPMPWPATAAGRSSSPRRDDRPRVEDLPVAALRLPADLVQRWPSWASTPSARSRPRPRDRWPSPGPGTRRVAWTRPSGANPNRSSRSWPPRPCGSARSSPSRSARPRPWPAMSRS
jgi:hypothetical protein